MVSIPKSEDLTFGSLFKAAIADYREHRKGVVKDIHVNYIGLGQKAMFQYLGNKVLSALKNVKDEFYGIPRYEISIIKSRGKQECFLVRGLIKIALDYHYTAGLNMPKSLYSISSDIAHRKIYLSANIDHAKLESILNKIGRRNKIKYTIRHLPKKNGNNSEHIVNGIS